MANEAYVSFSLQFSFDGLYNQTVSIDIFWLDQIVKKNECIKN